MLYPKSSYWLSYIFSTTDLQTAELRLTAGANRLLLPLWISRVCALSACSTLDQRLSEILRAFEHDYSSACVIHWIHWFWYLRLTSANHDIGRMHRWNLPFGLHHVWNHMRAAQYSSHLDRSLILRQTVENANATFILHTQAWHA